MNYHLECKTSYFGNFIKQLVFMYYFLLYEIFYVDFSKYVYPVTPLITQASLIQKKRVAQSSDCYNIARNQASTALKETKLHLCCFCQRLSSTCGFTRLQGFLARLRHYNSLYQSRMKDCLFVECALFDNIEIYIRIMYLNIHRYYSYTMLLDIPLT